MNNFAMNVTFETVDDTRVRAYVNDKLAGTVTFKSVKEKLRLTFRNSNSPFKCVIRERNFADAPLNAMTVPEAIKNRDVLTQLIPIVIRNFLYNSDFLTA